MEDIPSPCLELAELIAIGEATLPPKLPCDALQFLRALHQVALGNVLSYPTRARRAAAAAWCIARRFRGDLLLLAQAHWTHGSTIAYIPNYIGALAHYDAALDCYQQASVRFESEPAPVDVRVVHIPRVFCLTELGRYREALEVVALAENLFEEHTAPYARLTLLLNQSLLVGRMGDYEHMVALADVTIALARKLGETAREAQGQINRGHACVFLGRFPEAEIALREGIALATKVGQWLTVARARWNYAKLLRCQGFLFDALTALREAQQGLAEAAGEAATVAMEKASLYEQLRQLPEAQRSARQAAEQFALQSMPAYSADAAIRAARIAVQQRRASIAGKYLAFAAAQASQTQMPALNAEIELVETLLTMIPAPDSSPRRRRQQQRDGLGLARGAIKRLQEAGLVREATEGEHTVAALEALLGNIREAKAIYRRLAAAHNDRQTRMAACAELGGLLRPVEALPYLQQAAALAVEQRRALPMEELQARYSSETSPYHMRLAACCLSLGDIPQAIESIWSAKAGPLLDLRVASGILDGAFLSRLEKERTDLARWREQVHDHRRKAKEAAQQDQLERHDHHVRQAEVSAMAARASEQRLTEMMRSLSDRTGQAHIPGVAKVQAALAPGMVLLEYVQVGDTLLSFMIRPHGPIEYRWLGAVTAVEQQYDRWKLICHRLMTEAPSFDPEAQIRDVLIPVWEQLLAPWQAYLDDTTHLLIAPCGILHHVPWAALPNGERYLSDRVTITLTPCGALWAAPFDPHVALGPPCLLGYAGDGDFYLEHVEREIDAIAYSMPSAQVVKTAKRRDLQFSLPPCLLHIAAHALTNPTAPLCSTIELADGPFLLLEAHRLNLRGTHLVTLSACETGVRPDHGDMVLALAGAFLCAGARAVLASLWPVSDSAAAALMDTFYAALSKGQPAPAALQEAQRAVRSRHPLDWISFQLWAGAPIA